MSGAERYLIFKIGENYLATELLKIKEVLTTTANFIPVPQSSPQCLGALNLRGSITSVIDLGGKLGIQKSEENIEYNEKGERKKYLMVLNHPETNIGLLVDKICAVNEVKIEEHNQSFSNSLGKAEKYLKGMAEYKDDILAIIDLISLIDEDIIKAGRKTA